MTPALRQHYAFDDVDGDAVGGEGENTPSREPRPGEHCQWRAVRLTNSLYT